MEKQHTKSRSNSVKYYNHVAQISERYRVSRIAGFDDTQIEAETSVGLLFIRGEELVINNFDAESGELSYRVR